MSRIVSQCLYFTSCLLILWPCSIFGQINSVEDIVQKFDQYSRKTLQEKLYIHTDQSAFLTGETIWFKAYYVDGSIHRPLDISKVAYLELIDQNNKPVLQTKIALKSGSGNGSFFLPASINSGNYLLRAYTHWMKNFSQEYFFEKPITIINTFKQLEQQPAKDSASYDIQLFPEGGNLVQNLGSKVAFRATDRYGKGIDFTGVVLTQENDTIARFFPQKFGIGKFSFTPLPGKEYRAVIKVANNKLITQKLPVADTHGYTLQLHDTGADEIKITVKARLRDNLQPSSVYLLAHTRQIIKVAERQDLQQNEATFIINKRQLGDGISHITIFNASYQPVCERLFFKMPEQMLVIEPKPDQDQYTSRKKVILDIFTRNTEGSPIVAEMSAAVYKVDSMQINDTYSLPSYLLLDSDLTGKVESPHYYFSSREHQNNADIDNLMLTHGWRRFRWQSLLNEDSLVFKFIPEYEGHLVQGCIANITNNAPAPNINVYLSVPGRHFQLHISQSNYQGEVNFALNDVYGTKQIVTQTNSQQDSLYRIELLSPYFLPEATLRLPYFYVHEQLKEQLLTRSIGMQTQNMYFSDKRRRFFSNPRDTTAFYGTPDAQYKLDAYTRFPQMEDVLKEYVPGVQARKRRGKYHLEVIDLPHKLNFSENPLVLIDGVPVFDMDKIMSFNPLKVKRLDVVARKYFLGPLSFSGVLSYATYTGEVTDLPLDPAAVILDFEGLQLQREYYTPLYDSPQSINRRLPDYRHLLYWAPAVKTDKTGKTTLEFYTSDLEGEYRIVVEGITKNGEAGYNTSSFTVENPAR